ncbi:MAG: phosphoribosyltransferase [Bacteroidetes bacterium]|nr:phosphoribosyltransferase [Bacteroidota bacterium]
MTNERHQILTDKQVQQKLNRIAYQILESNYTEKELILVGIKPRGFTIAKKLSTLLKGMSEITITLCSMKINKSDPSAEEIKLDPSMPDVKDKVVILIDDVTDSGKTLTYAIKPFLNNLQKKIQSVVLVDRQHKRYPIAPDFVGLSLATTMQESISVELGKPGKEGAYIS